MLTILLIVIDVSDTEKLICMDNFFNSSGIPSKGSLTKLLFITDMLPSAVGALNKLSTTRFPCNCVKPISLLKVLSSI